MIRMRMNRLFGLLTIIMVACGNIGGDTHQRSADDEDGRDAGIQVAPQITSRDGGGDSGTTGDADGEPAGPANDDPCACDPSYCDAVRLGGLAALEADMCADSLWGVVTKHLYDSGWTRITGMYFDQTGSVLLDESENVIATAFRFFDASCGAGQVFPTLDHVVSECFVCGSVDRLRDPSMPDCGVGFGDAGGVDAGACVIGPACACSWQDGCASCVCP